MTRLTITGSDQGHINVKGWLILCLMSPKKLSDAVKQEILQLYRETDQTTSTLAELFGVSSSTISRFLKTHLSPTEYDHLIQQKRLARVTRTSVDVDLDLNLEEVALGLIHPQGRVEAEIFEETLFSQDEVILEQEHLFPTPEISLPEEISIGTEDEQEDGRESPQVSSLEYFYDEDEDDEDEDDDDDDWEDSQLSPPTLTTRMINLQVLPIAVASFPKTCYLVVDRSAELITRPLKDFAQLGKIPSEEFQQKTLPIFDNHKVAKRFSNRSQRVIKVPDGRILQKTSNYLHAKGITRLLMDGQIYSLSSS